MYVEDSVNIGK